MPVINLCSPFKVFGVLLISRLFRPLRFRRIQFGFTLIEVLVIVMLIGVMAAFSMPSLSGYLDSMKVKAAIADIRLTLQESQNQAIRRGEDCSANLFLPSTSSGSKSKGTVDASCNSAQRSIPKEVSISTNIKLSSSSSSSSSGLKSQNHPWPFASLDPLFFLAHHTEQVTQANASSESSSSSSQGSIGEAYRSSDSSNEFQSGGAYGSSDSSNEFQSSDDDDEENPIPYNPPPSPRSLPATSPTPSHSSGDSEKSFIRVQFSALGSANFEVKTSQSSPPDTTGKIIAFNGKRKTSVKRCIAISRTLGLTRVGTYQGDDSLTPEKITDQGTCAALDWTKQ